MIRSRVISREPLHIEVYGTFAHTIICVKCADSARDNEMLNFNDTGQDVFTVQKLPQRVIVDHAIV